MTDWRTQNLFSLNEEHKTHSFFLHPNMLQANKSILLRKFIFS
jgi:hypothetical protein